MFLGGGSGKILFKKKEEAIEFCKKLNDFYRNETDGAASITTVVVTELKDEEFKNWIYRAEKELRKQKDCKYYFFQPLTNPYFKICQSTGIYPAETIGQGDRELICQASYIKRKIEDEKDSVFFRKFKQYLEKSDKLTLSDDVKEKWTSFFNNKHIAKLLPKDLDDIGALSNGYVGLIYADGNRMGQRLAELDSSESYRKFSEKVKDGTQKAIFNALACHLGMKLKGAQKCFPFEILLLGGDDLVVVVPANKAVEIAIDFCDGFKAITNGISIAAGVIITHANYPIHRMIEHAEDLLKSAKNKCNEKPVDEICAIDFMVLKGALLQDVKEMRQRELSYFSDDQVTGEPDIKLYQRPYTTTNLHKLINWIRKLKSCGFPRNKLKAMYESLYRGIWQASLDYIMILSRLPLSSEADVLTSSARKAIMDFTKEWDGGLDIFPWKKNKSGFETPFLDMIELYDFVEDNKEQCGE
jgi:CRISPR-associated protein Cmr2